MTTAHDIDLREVLTDRISPASPDLLRRLLSTFIDALMGAEAGESVEYQDRQDAIAILAAEPDPETQA